MDQTLADAQSIAETLGKLNRRMQSLTAELNRRAGQERVVLQGTIAPRDTTLAQRTMLDSLLCTKLVELTGTCSRLLPQIESVEAHIAELDSAPRADEYQLHRIRELQDELGSVYGVTVSRTDVLTYLWKRYTR